MTDRNRFPRYSPSEIDRIGRAGSIVSETIRRVCEAAVPGMTTAGLSALASQLLDEADAEPIFQTEAGFPAPCCLSINEEVAHGVPGSRVLAVGDLLSIDLGCRTDGFCADAARSIRVNRSPRANDSDSDSEVVSILRAGWDLLDTITRSLQPERSWSEVVRVAETTADRHNVRLIIDLPGHGIGRRLHEEPQLPLGSPPGLSDKSFDFRLQSGMVLAIEPMVTFGEPTLGQFGNRWTWETIDGSPAAHFEWTVAVTDDGPRVLTPIDSPLPRISDRLAPDSVPIPGFLTQFSPDP